MKRVVRLRIHDRTVSKRTLQENGLIVELNSADSGQV